MFELETLIWIYWKYTEFYVYPIQFFSYQTFLYRCCTISISFGFAHVFINISAHHSPSHCSPSILANFIFAWNLSSKIYLNKGLLVVSDVFFVCKCLYFVFIHKKVLCYRILAWDVFFLDIFRILLPCLLAPVFAVKKLVVWFLALCRWYIFPL